MSEVWTVLRILEWTRTYLQEQGSPTPRLDAEILLTTVLDVDRVGLYTAYDRPMSSDERARYRGLVRRRASGEPVQYITGEQEFWSITFRVEAGVLIPRPETELLVEEVVAEAGRMEAPSGGLLRIADVGTGSGCVAVALATELEHVEIVATDIEPIPLRVARDNAERAGVGDRVSVVVADGLDGVDLTGGAFDLIASNPPYIPDGQFDGLMRSVRDFEPRTALTAGPEGLDVIAPLIERASDPAVLTPGGALALEVSDAIQAEQCLALFEKFGLVDSRIRLDYSGLPRVVVARARIG